jgi:hypothetical protein
MPRKRSEAAGLLRFFSDEPMEKAEFVYEMIQDTMRARRAKVAEKANAKPAAARRKKPGKKAAAAGAGVPLEKRSGPTTIIDGEPQADVNT